MSGEFEWERGWEEVCRRIKPGSLRFYPSTSKHTVTYFRVSYVATEQKEIDGTTFIREREVDGPPVYPKDIKTPAEVRLATRIAEEIWPILTRYAEQAATKGWTREDGSSS